MNLYIKKISVFNFRNHDKLSFGLEPRSVVITGLNGIGKTNLLEAVSLLSPTRGLRGAKFADILPTQSLSLPPEGEEKAKQANAWSVSADVVNPFETCHINTGYIDNKRAVKIDGKTPKTNGELSQKLNLAWIIPQMDGLFIGGSSDRRKFLDRLVQNFEPRHIERLSHYEKSVRERNRLLEIKPFNKSWLAGLEVRIAEEGVAIAAARIDTVDRLNTIERKSVFPSSRITITGEIEEMLKTMPAVSVEQKFTETLEQNRNLDSATGRTTSGVHRSDLEVSYNDKPARICSTGEQKALLLGIILSYAHSFSSYKGYAPILLLDEVIAHLDNNRRQELFKELAELNSQVWMTGVNQEDFKGMDAQFLSL